MSRRRAVAWCAATLGALLIAAACDSESPEPAPADGRAELLALAERGAVATWWVEATFVRTAPGGASFKSRTFALNRPPDYLSGSSETVNGVVDGESVSCSNTTEPTGERRRVCAAPQPAPPPPANGSRYPVLTADSIAGYEVVPLDERTIAGLPARCFRLALADGAEPGDWGVRGQTCFSDDGVPLLRRTEKEGVVDEVVTTEVRRKVTDADLADLIDAPEPGPSTTTSVPSNP